ncbi:NAD(P)-dependent oxidoreductase [Niabella beijingensis]|uniref:NAD(P)-dependent oxidoreductase n=1 Tax=Niabella beijingensis TaxID=2872700 RepID=UPI001CBC2E8D|nr:NAD(P)H-binding protein [Niabella beijingensis]MBZ4187810.1 NAD(P)H-binding protein [Niabella beijingensis]
MQLIIFGATGSVGQQLIEQAIAKKIHVKAFTRNASRLASFQSEYLSVFEGDVLNYADVLNALDPDAIVVNTLGNGKHGNTRSAGTRNIIKAMEEKKAGRLICQTTLGCGSSRGNLNFLWRHIMFGWLLKDAYYDHVLQEEAVMSSNLQWTIVRPSAFAKGPVTGSFRTGFGPAEKGLRLKIATADIAYYILSELNATPENSRKAVSISN